MKKYALKSILIATIIILATPMMKAQFDDVYYDPDKPNPVKDFDYTNDTNTAPTDEFGVTYYDDDSYDYEDDDYAYYDDYDYYYSSRIRRFHHSYSGFDYYAPAYTSYYYYDPFYSDAYYYPGSTIYINFGSSDYWDYRHWRRWNRWNTWNNYSSWSYGCGSPYNNYYSYNSWNNWNNHYWNGNNGYYSYSNYYNNYNYGCPFPIGNYNGITHTTVDWVNNGGTRGTYYGPRITGNTGSSPRGPINPPGNVQPVLEGNNGVSVSNDKPERVPSPSLPGRNTSGAPVTNGTDDKPVIIPGTRTEAGGNVIKQVPEDKDLKRDNPITDSKRPVFKPDANQFKPYPTERPAPVNNTQDKPIATERPVYRPYTPTKPVEEKPVTRPDAERPSYKPEREEVKPSYRPSPGGSETRPAYTPPTRNEERPAYRPPTRPTESNQDKPSYTPPQRSNDSDRSESRPSYSPPPRSNDSGRSESKPSYTPRNDAPSQSSPSRDNSSSRSSSSSSSSSGSHSSSPRGKG